MKKILIVDDEPTILSGLSKAIYNFCDFDGEVKTVGNGKDAINEIGLCHYDICFLDLKLPDIHGLDVMKKINEISPETKIAIMTACIIDDDMEKKIKEGSSIFLPKPVNLSTFKAFIKQVLEKGGHTCKGRESFPDSFRKERRHCERLSVVELISCSICNPDCDSPEWTEHKNTLFDINDAGIGILSDNQLKPGFMFKYKRGNAQKEGVVKWCIEADNYWRAGIKFS